MPWTLPAGKPDTLKCVAELMRFVQEGVSVANRCEILPNLASSTRSDACENAGQIGVQLRRNRLSVRLRRPWTVDGVAHDTDTVLTITLPDLLAGERTFTVLWRPDERRALQRVVWSAGRLIVDVLEDLRSTYRIFEPGLGGWTEQPLAALPALGSVYLWPLDGDPERSDGGLLALAHDPVTPPPLLAFPRSTPRPYCSRRPGPSTRAASG